MRIVDKVMGRERQGGGQGASVKVMGRLDWEFEIMILIRIMDLKSVSLCERPSARCGKKQIKFTRRLEGGERGGVAVCGNRARRLE